MGHSMGGHLGAHLLSRRPGSFAGAVLCAPMVDFNRGVPLPRFLAWIMARIVCRFGRAQHFGPGTNADLPSEKNFASNKLTTCPDRYAAAMALMRAEPALLVSGATWGWLQAALASTLALNRVATIRRITMPTLIAIAGADRLVDNTAIQRFAHLLPRGELIEFPGARHELLNESDAHRLALWAAIDRFIEAIPC